MLIQIAIRLHWFLLDSFQKKFFGLSWVYTAVSQCAIKMSITICNIVTAKILGIKKKKKRIQFPVHTTMM